MDQLVIRRYDDRTELYFGKAKAQVDRSGKRPIFPTPDVVISRCITDEEAADLRAKFAAGVREF
jgi:hypothetical protein